MQTQEKIEKKGGFIQPAQAATQVNTGSCCGSASGGGCCGEPVQQVNSIPVSAVSCCGEPALQTEKQPTASSGCCG